MFAAVKGKLKLQLLHHAGNAGNEDTCGGRLEPKGAVPRKAVHGTGNRSCSEGPFKLSEAPMTPPWCPDVGTELQSASLMGLVLCPMLSSYCFLRSVCMPLSTANMQLGFLFYKDS